MKLKIEKINVKMKKLPQRKHMKNFKNMKNIGREKGGWENHSLPDLPDPRSDSKLRTMATLKND